MADRGALQVDSCHTFPKCYVTTALCPITHEHAMPHPALTIDPLLAAWAVFALSTLSPGPATLATIAAATTEGRKAGLLVGLGVTLGSLT